MTDRAYDPDLDLDPDDPGWWGYASCPQTDSEAFFPPKGGATAPARRVCMRCMVRATCLEYALRYQVSDGIWGGKSPEQRRKILRERRAA